VADQWHEGDHSFQVKAGAKVPFPLEFIVILYKNDTFKKPGKILKIRRNMAERGSLVFWPHRLQTVHRCGSFACMLHIYMFSSLVYSSLIFVDNKLMLICLLTKQQLVTVFVRQVILLIWQVLHHKKSHDCCNKEKDVAAKCCT